ncbi:hypothetical protein TA3x_000359 [Tundrisphaera sp. TA3]|uniref:hypothetical protein n=1 Tax=Tundrisphaera sp. TA3 TaxID=3435775 RepID=UPI003EB813DA
MGPGLRAVGLAFALAASLGSNARASITVYNLFKTIDYRQTSIAQPTTPVRYYGAAAVDFNNPGDLTGALVSSSSPNSPFTLNLTGPGSAYYGTPAYATKAELDRVIPNGTAYTYRLNGGTFNGQAATLSTPASDSYTSTVPFFTGNTYAALQNVDASRSILLTFNPFTAPAGTTNASTFLKITRVADGVPVYDMSGPSSLSSASVGANTLAAGTQYNLSIVYSSRISTPGAGFGGATSLISYDLRTELTFTTAAAVPEPASIVSAAIGAVCVLGYRSRRRGASVG